MDIKLRARLSAYSKIESVQSGSTLPDVEDLKNGSVLGVKDGKYKMYEPVSQAAIKGLFGNSDPEPTTIRKSEIDTLFPGEKPAVSAGVDRIDTLFTNTSPTAGVIVSHEAIDSLFN